MLDLLLSNLKNLKMLKDSSSFMNSIQQFQIIMKED
jgi:hypothetical protein